MATHNRLIIYPTMILCDHAYLWDDPGDRYHGPAHDPRPRALANTNFLVHIREEPSLSE